jgi:hypothetical protein
VPVVHYFVSRLSLSTSFICQEIAHPPHLDVDPSLFKRKELSQSSNLIFPFLYHSMDPCLAFLHSNELNINIFSLHFCFNYATLADNENIHPMVCARSLQFNISFFPLLSNSTATEWPPPLELNKNISISNCNIDEYENTLRFTKASI